MLPIVPVLGRYSSDGFGTFCVVCSNLSTSSSPVSFYVHLHIGCHSLAAVWCSLMIASWTKFPGLSLLELKYSDIMGTHPYQDVLLWASITCLKRCPTPSYQWRISRSGSLWYWRSRNEKAEDQTVGGGSHLSRQMDAWETYTCTISSRRLPLHKWRVSVTASHQL